MVEPSLPALLALFHPESTLILLFLFTATVKNSLFRSTVIALYSKTFYVDSFDLHCFTDPSVPSSRSIELFQCSDSKAQHQPSYSALCQNNIPPYSRNSSNTYGSRFPF